jgi:hypothetical protein
MVIFPSVIEFCDQLLPVCALCPFIMVWFPKC